MEMGPGKSSPYRREMGCLEKGVLGRKWGVAGEIIGSVSILARGESYCAK